MAFATFDHGFVEVLAAHAAFAAANVAAARNLVRP
jgi:hypothetical protein